MFKKFFQRKPKVSDKDRQLQRIDTLDSSSPQHLSQLLELAKNDPDPNIRSAAASRIGLRDCLANLLKDEQDITVRARLIKRLFEQCGDEDAIEIATNLLRHADSDTARIALLADVQQPAAATFIATRIQDPQALVETAVSHKISRVRLAAAQQLSSEEQLQELVHKSRDKSVNQWVRSQLKELKQQRHQDEEKQARAEKLLESSQQLAISENPLDYRQRLARLQLEFEELQPQLEPQQLTALETLLHTSTERAETFEAAQAAAIEAPMEISVQNAEPAPTVETPASPPFVEHDPQAGARDLLAAPLQTMLDAPAVPDQAQISALLESSQQAWALIEEDQAEHAYHAAHSRLSDALNSQRYLDANHDALAAICATPFDEQSDDQDLKALQHNIKEYIDVLRWPSQWEAPASLLALRATRLQVQDLQHQRREQARKRAQQLEKKLHRMADALRRKNLRLANNIHREVLEALPKIADSEQAKLQRLLDKHQPELEKLLDWHEYSATPKKEALCTQMETLIEREMPPEARAESIKKLREEWRAVTAANVKKDDPLWTRFNTAAEAAYAPCTPYFEKLKERKRENLQQRERLSGELDQLLASVDWDNPPFDLLDKALRTARAEWQQYSPVHFPEAKRCQKRFDAAMDKIHKALQSQRKSHAEAREQLIQRASALAESTDTEGAIAQALSLQDAWKKTGPVAPNVQRKQWQQFRKHMDAVFARRQAERDASQDEQQKQRAEVDALLDKLESLVALPDDQIPQSLETIAQLQAEIDTAKQDMPKRLQSTLSTRENKLLNHLSEKQQSLPRRRRAASYAALATLASDCHQAEQAQLRGEPVAAISLQDSPWQSLMQARVDQVNATAEALSATLEDNRISLERLAIELEILAEVDTPEAHRGQRRAWQLDLLEAGYSHQDALEPDDQFFELLQRWHAVGAIEQADRDSLEARLATASQPFRKRLKLDTVAPQAETETAG